MAAYLNNQQQMQHPTDPHHEIIPLQRMTTREEATERQRIRDIFDKVSLGIIVMLVHIISTKNAYFL